MNVHVCMNIMSVLRMHIYGFYICMYRKSKICMTDDEKTPRELIRYFLLLLVL